MSRVVQNTRGVLGVCVQALTSTTVRLLKFQEADRDCLLALHFLLLGALRISQRRPVFRRAKDLPSEHDEADEDRKYNQALYEFYH